MRVVDTSGLKCPQPIIETKKALTGGGKGEIFRVIIDNHTSYRNVTRFLDDNGIEYSSGEGDGKWTLTVNSDKGTLITSEAEDYCETGITETKGSGFGIAVASDIMGSGDDDLGRRLMRSFFVSVSCLEGLPSVIAFYNSGVKLMADDPEITDIVAELETKGVEVLICGTCIDHYKLSGKTGAGKTSDMFTIVTRLAASGNVIRP